MIVTLAYVTRIWRRREKRQLDETGRANEEVSKEERGQGVGRREK